MSEGHDPGPTARRVALTLCTISAAVSIAAMIFIAIQVHAASEQLRQSDLRLLELLRR
ncbi:hypothetical protein [Chelatococcus reniformis]|uniref:Uncharacterized protein n=1 Tax=Chelatococcus reniformis TaxID=1494448 RepID=A0A916UDA8_9HYPH|nr:hypothetical protein [Chelatococcus reniformis]GGC68314.1 hypothetical protein GCM10010994_28620 [Chelatococcus reniformis]